MSSTFDIKSLPLYRQIALLGGVLLFISLFFPWWSASVDFGELGGGIAGSANGWDGIGTLVGLLVIVLIAWEVLRTLGQTAQVQFNHDLITAGLGGLIALFGVIQFIRALTYGPDMPGVSTGPGFGAFLILIFSLALGYAAFMAFQAAGGQAALKDAQGQGRGADPAADDGQDDDGRSTGSNPPPPAG